MEPLIRNRSIGRCSMPVLVWLRYKFWVPAPAKLPHTDIDNPWCEDVWLQGNDKHLMGKVNAIDVTIPPV